MWLNKAILSRNAELILNLRLILLNENNPSPKNGLKSWTIRKNRLLGRLFCEEVFLVLLLLGLPLAAQAGVFSFISNLWSGDQIANVGNFVNSQNIPLLQAASSFDPNPARGGGDITIIDGSALMAESGPSGTAADIEEGQKNGQISIYIVRKGDSLSGIAKMFKVSVNTIIWANNLQKSQIHEGESLIILPISGIQYTVKKGDTLNSIVKKYKANLAELLQYNDLSVGTTLAEGQTILIPDVDISLPASSYSSTAKVHGAGGPEYPGYYLRPIPNGLGHKTQGLHGYNAIDIGASFGTPIIAAASGKAIIARSSGWNGGYGSYVVLSHDNGTQTLYGHMNEVIIYEGANVVRGQVIGYVGSTGKSTGAHLHFEIRGAKNPF